MGDMAEMTNDRCLIEVEEIYEYEDQGFPQNQESCDKGLIDELGYEKFTDADFSIPISGYFSSVPTVKRSKFKACKYCGFSKLIWKDTDKGWRLAHPDGEEHACDEYLEETSWDNIDRET